MTENFPFLTQFILVSFIDVWPQLSENYLKYFQLQGDIHGLLIPHTPPPPFMRGHIPILQVLKGSSRFADQMLFKMKIF